MNEARKCNCNATVWCYIDGYLIKPPTKRTHSEKAKAVKNEPTIRLCAAGKLCLRYEHRKAAPAKGRGQYCSRNCSESFKVRSRASNPSLAQPTAALSEIPV